MFEETIITNLIYNEEYFRKVFPYLKEDYFEDNTLRKIFSTYSEYVENYKDIPSTEALKISLEKRKDFSDDEYKLALNTVDSLKLKENKIEFLFNETEKFCQDRDLFNAIRRSITILDGKDKELDKGAIPKMISDSLGISFNTSIGHDFLEDFETRYDFYHKVEERIETDIDLLNKIIKGGFPKKSLSVFLATTGGGKSLLKCHIASTCLMYGKNVLYITMEMAEERIAQRIDANLLDITLDELEQMPKDVYERKIHRIKSKTTGQLIIKEYPTGSAHAGHFRHLIDELRLKKNFVPDIIFIDYLNICASSRIRGNNANSYTIVKSIAEEIRGLAMEFNVPIISSSQFNRAAYGSSDVDLENTSESIGLAYTCDLILALITSEELDEMGQIMIKQLKNRWGDLSYYRKFVIGVDRAKMKVFNLEDGAQKKIINPDSGPVMDKSNSFDKPKNTKHKEVGDLK